MQNIIINKDNIISSTFGLIIGFLAGLIGIGGGEYRAPVLIYLLKLGMKFAIATNLLIGLFTVSTSFFVRLNSFDFSKALLVICLIMAVTSMIGAYCGARATKKLDDPFLKRVFGVILLVASIKVFFYTPKSCLSDFELSSLIIFLSAFFGLLIGFISGLLGVAGGEFRIPALILIIGLPIKIAGTVNLLISIFTVLIGFLKHRNLGHINRRSLIIAFSMGIFSILGASIGANLSAVVSDDTVKKTLAALMLLVAVKMLVKP